MIAKGDRVLCDNGADGNLAGEVYEEQNHILGSIIVKLDCDGSYDEELVGGFKPPSEDMAP